MDSSPPCVSFIGIVDFSQEARWIYMTESVTDLLGYEPSELVGRPSLELVHPDEFPRVRQLHYDTIQQDKAAVLVYLRLKHKDPYKGYILCGISRTVVHNVLVGSVSFASSGAKALHNASTAQEITIISPTTENFQLRRWNDPSPLPPSPIPRHMGSLSPTPTSPWQSPSPRSDSEAPNSPDFDRERRTSKEDVITFDHLPNQSFRTAFILDRFSMHSTILYCSNDLLVSTTDCIGRSFYDFVTKKDEPQVRSWVDCVKGWGVNERGQPSDGGFGFGRFLLITEGRNSIERLPDPVTSRSKHTHGHGGKPRSTKSAHTTNPSGRHRQRRHDSSSPPFSPTSMNDLNSPQFPVDAIFSAHSDGLMVILRRATS